MKKVKISKHIKTKAEKILVIGSCGSGIESRLLNHNLKQNDRFIIYQSIEQMKMKEDDFCNYDCIVIFSTLLDGDDYIKEFLLRYVISKDSSMVPLSYYIPAKGTDLKDVIVFKKYISGYTAYRKEKLENKL